MDQATQAEPGNGWQGWLRRAVPVPWQLGTGFALAALALLLVRLPAWPAATTWQLMPVNLLAVTAAAAGAGLFAGLAAAAVILLFYLERFTTTAGHNADWLPLLGFATLAIASFAGWLRQSLGTIEQELSGSRAMLEGANRRLAAAQETERLRAYYDHVTALPSRRMVIDRFSQILSHARRSEALLCVLLLDLNRFKEVNETVGYDAGDEVLCQFGQRLTAVMRREDTVGRLESDTFVVLLPDLNDAAGAAIAAQKIADALQEPFVAGSPPREIFVSARLGAALYPHDGNDWESLYRYAEEAMWLARRPA